MREEGPTVEEDEIMQLTQSCIRTKRFLQAGSIEDVCRIGLYFNVLCYRLCPLVDRRVLGVIANAGAHCGDRRHESAGGMEGERSSVADIYHQWMNRSKQWLYQKESAFCRATSMSLVSLGALAPKEEPC